MIFFFQVLWNWILILFIYILFRIDRRPGPHVTTVGAYHSHLITTSTNATYTTKTTSILTCIMSTTPTTPEPIHPAGVQSLKPVRDNEPQPPAKKPTLNATITKMAHTPQATHTTVAIYRHRHRWAIKATTTACQAPNIDHDHRKNRQKDQRIQKQLEHHHPVRRLLVHGPGHTPGPSHRSARALRSSPVRQSHQKAVHRLHWLDIRAPRLRLIFPRLDVLHYFQHRLVLNYRRFLVRNERFRVVV